MSGGETAELGAGAWPRAAFQAPVLRALGQRERSEIAAAGRMHRLLKGDVVYQAREPSDAFFVVVSGAIELMAVRRGDESESALRVARRGDTLGEEALLSGALRWATARALQDSEIAEVPVAVLLRAAERSGAGEALEREQRALRRLLARDLLRTTALGRDLSDDDLDLLLDAVTHRSLPRGARVFSVGDRADACFVVADGLVQLQTEDDEKIQVRAYVCRGDFFGDDELVRSERRKTSAVALGDCQLLVIPGRALTTLSDRNPSLLGRMRRVSADREAFQLDLVGAARERSTQHVFQDLYRMQMARSLLAIDQESCVRCGHCSYACAEVHGVSRLIRRGDKIITELVRAEREPKSLLLPNSCQHCKNPVCMLDCPTGAIGRDPRGEVFIRDALCTGCGACAKACPWENIRMAPRAEPNAPPEIAVKCDLCRDYEAPACVSACPTESILRLDPSRDVSEVARLLGANAAASEQVTPRKLLERELTPFGIVIALSVALGITGLVSRADGVLSAAHGVGLLAGWLGLIATLALAAYAIPKRAIRWWLKKRERKSAARRALDPRVDEAPARSRLRPLAQAHVLLGLFATAAVATHAGPAIGGGLTGALALAFWLTAFSGVFGALAYRVLPARLSRIERKGTLPEDLAAERELLFDRLYRAISGKSELVKKLADRVLLPYARAPLGAFWLALSGRGLRAEQARLRQQIDALLEGRGGDKLAGIDELVQIVVELRALPARRWLTRLLRGWLLVHVLVTAALLGLLALHVAAVVIW